MDLEGLRHLSCPGERSPRNLVHLQNGRIHTHSTEAAVSRWDGRAFGELRNFGEGRQGRNFRLIVAAPNAHRICERRFVGAACEVRRRTNSPKRRKKRAAKRGRKRALLVSAYLHARAAFYAWGRHRVRTVLPWYVHSSLLQLNRD